MNLPERGIGAHRGARATHPENTVPAFVEAVRLGAAMVEFDLRQTADGEIAVIHDREVDRTTDGHGAVAELSLAEIRKLDAGRHQGEEFAGTRIPTLDEALEALPRDVWLNIQVKRGEPVAAAAARRIAENDRLHQAFLACGNSAARDARAAVPDIQICNLVRQETRLDYVEHCRNTGANFLQLHWLRGMPEPEVIDAAHGAGLRVNYLTRAEDPRVRAVWDTGADFVLVNDVAAAISAIADAG